MKSLKDVYHDDLSSQCIEILYMWINSYLERHDLALLEFNWEEKFVACYKKDCDNLFEDYFTFDYTKVNLFSKRML